MPIVINEIVIKTNIEKNEPAAGNTGTTPDAMVMEDIVKQAVEKVMDILEERKQR